MTRNVCIGAVFATLVVTAWLGACGRQVTGPTPVVVITAPSNLKFVGQTGQLTAQVTAANGSQSDVTATAVWSSSNHSVATVSATGLVTLIASGVTTITARISSGQTGTLSLTVVNPINVPVAGRVSEAGGFGLPQVQVTIVGGAKDGAVTQTDQYGNYSVSDAAGAQQVRATKDGYNTATVSVGSNPTQVNVTLTPTTPYADLHGTWHLTLGASATCQLPDEAKTRKYTAAIEQDNARLTIHLSDAQFLSNRTTENWIFGRVYGNDVTLTVGKADDSCFYYGECLVEQLASGSTLTLDGTAAGSVSGNVLATLLAGTITVSASPSGTAGAACTAPDHHLTFTR